MKIDLKNNPNTVIFTRQGLHEGSIGIAPQEVDGCIVTENMPMFSIDESIVLSAYLKLLFKSKPANKVILISDALPITHSDMKEAVFADSKIYYDGVKATSADGTIAGSTMLLDEIVERLKRLDLFSPEYIENAWRYHGLESKDYEI